MDKDFLLNYVNVLRSRGNIGQKLQLPPLGGSLLIGWEPQVQKKNNVLHCMTPTKLDDYQISYLFL
jgi:hypothetical protein